MKTTLNGLFLLFSFITAIVNFIMQASPENNISKMISFFSIIAIFIFVLVLLFLLIYDTKNHLYINEKLKTMENIVSRNLYHMNDEKIYNILFKPIEDEFNNIKITPIEKEKNKFLKKIHQKALYLHEIVRWLDRDDLTLKFIIVIKDIANELKNKKLNKKLYNNIFIDEAWIKIKKIDKSKMNEMDKKKEYENIKKVLEDHLKYASIEMKYKAYRHLVYTIKKINKYSEKDDDVSFEKFSKKVKQYSWLLGYSYRKFSNGRAGIFFMQIELRNSGEVSDENIGSYLHLNEKQVRFINRSREFSREAKSFCQRGKIYKDALLKTKDDSKKDNYYQEAVKNYKKGIEIAEKYYRIDIMAECLYELISLYNNQHNQIKEIKEYIQKAYYIAKYTNNASLRNILKKQKEVFLIILIRHGFSKKNLEQKVGGNFTESDYVLTGDGKTWIEEQSERICDYLKKIESKIKENEIQFIAGTNNKKDHNANTANIMQNVFINKKLVHKNSKKVMFVEELRKIDLGILAGETLDMAITENRLKEKGITRGEWTGAVKALIKWRTGEYSTNEMKGKIKGMEDFGNFWERGEDALNKIQQYSIISCSSSIFTLLTHIMLGNEITSEKYKYLAINNGCIVAFWKIFDDYIFEPNLSDIILFEV